MNRRNLCFDAHHVRAVHNAAKSLDWCIVRRVTFAFVWSKIINTKTAVTQGLGIIISFICRRYAPVFKRLIERRFEFSAAPDNDDSATAVKGQERRKCRYTIQTTGRQPRGKSITNDIRNPANKRKRLLSKRTGIRKGQLQDDATSCPGGHEMSTVSAESGWSSLGGRSGISCEVIAVWELEGETCFSLERCLGPWRIQYLCRIRGGSACGLCERKVLVLRSNFSSGVLGSAMVILCSVLKQRKGSTRAGNSRSW